MRKSLAERAATGQRVHQLENFTAEGKPVADPEDDKLWLSMESKHRLLEFDFARTWEQVGLPCMSSNMVYMSLQALCWRQNAPLLMPAILFFPGTWQTLNSVGSASCRTLHAWHT